MTSTLFNTYLVVIAAVVALTGTVDAALSGEGDLLLVFLVLLLLLVVMIVRTAFHRRIVPGRSDLFRWITQRAAVSGQTVEAVTDRAVAVYRQGFEGEPSVGELPVEGGARR